VSVIVETIYFFHCQQCPFRGLHFSPEGLDERTETMREHRLETGHAFVTWEVVGVIESRQRTEVAR
jgi:hypothetical protein